MIVPARRPEDAALDRLEANEPEYASDAATVREALERHREENARLVNALDGMARAPYGEYQKAHERAESAEAEVRRLRQIGGRDCFDFDANGPCGECVTCLNGKIVALEDEVRRLTEGLRERDELIRKTIYSPPGFSGPDPWWADEARALLSASPSDGDAPKQYWLNTTTKPDDSIVDATGVNSTCPSDGGGA